MITETLMKPGQWSVPLVADTPPSIRQKIQEFDHIIITPTRMEVSGLSDANMLAASRYTGVILEKPQKQGDMSISGAGLPHWLGTDKGAGDLLDAAVTVTAASLSSALGSLRPSSIAAGTVTNPGGTITHTFQWMTRREAIDWVCKAFLAEWRINPAGTLDAAVPATLFVSSPKAMITRRAEGADALFRGIEPLDLIQSVDVFDYASKIIVVSELGDGAKQPVQSATGSNLYKDLFNNNVVMERLVNSPNSDAALGANFASSVLAQYSTPRKSVSLNSRSYMITAQVKPGDWVWVYDEEANLYDTANQVYWRGRTFAPVKLRCVALTWPVERGMGVYARRSGATPVYVDLTPYVAWENGQTTAWEVGTGINDPNADDTSFGAAYLGVNPDILLRTTLGAMRSYTPAFSGTVVNGTLLGDYRVVGDVAEGNIIYVRGTSDTHGAGTITFGFPSGLSPSMQDGAPIGYARLIDASVPANYGRGVFNAAGVMAMMTEAGTFVSNTTPFTIATSDQYLIQWKVRLA